MSTAAPSVTVRRAAIPDAGAILPLASKFYQRTVYAALLGYSEQKARATLLGALDRGVVFVLEDNTMRHGPTDPEVHIVGGLMAILASPPYSDDWYAHELGWFVDDDYRGHGDALRRHFEQWAAQIGVPCYALADIKLDNSMPNGALYERAGYEVVERTWIKCGAKGLR